MRIDYQLYNHHFGNFLRSSRLPETCNSTIRWQFECYNAVITILLILLMLCLLQCVKLSKFETERSISFVPPDGEFELMRYYSFNLISFKCSLGKNYRPLALTCEVLKCPANVLPKHCK